jgi:chorismate synthase
MIVSRLAVKPIPTLMTPLSSVDLKTKKKKKASKIRSDVCVVESVGVISEAMLAICLTQSFLDKFGADDLKSIKSSYNQYLNR